MEAILPLSEDFPIPGGSFFPPDQELPAIQSQKQPAQKALPQLLQQSSQPDPLSPQREPKQLPPELCRQAGELPLPLPVPLRFPTDRVPTLQPLLYKSILTFYP